MAEVAEVDVVEAKEQQRRESRRATLEELESKRAREREVPVVLGEDDEPVTFLLRALGPKAWDRLVTKFPPTVAQRADGAQYDPEKFGPALLAKVIVEPEASAEWWAARWSSENWSAGEIQGLFWECVNLCNRGFDPAPSAAG